MEIKSFRLKNKPIKNKMPKILKIILCVLSIAFLAFGIYAALSNAGYIKAFQLAFQIQNKEQEDKEVLAQLKKIMLLPEDITPTMALITDIDALKQSQPDFFANAANGQRVFIYPKMAIIFDAKANKIIQVGPVQLDQNEQQPAPAPVNFAIYNSLTSDPTNAKTVEMENKIKAAFNNAVVTVKADSAKVNYPKTLVIDISGNTPDMEKIAVALGGQASGLPIGEKKPEGVGVLVIIGKE